MKGKIEVTMQGSTTIYAFEDSEVTIYDDKGSVLKRHTLIQNQSVLLTSIGYPRPCRVVSTGRILIGTWGGNTLTVLADSRGRFKGTWFAGFLFLDDGYLIVIPYETGRVYVYDEKGKLVGSEEFTEADIIVGVPWIFNSSTPGTLRIISTCNVTIFCGQYSMGDDFTTLVVPENEEIAFYLPPNLPSYAVVFSDRPVNVTIDGYYAFTLKGNDYHILISREELAYWFNSSQERGLVHFVGSMVHRLIASGPVTLAIYYPSGN